MRILLIVLCLLAAALYLKILVPGDDPVGDAASSTQAAADAPTGPTPGQQTRRPVPETQMQVIQDVFAPELSD